MGVNLFQYKTFQNIANGALELWSFGALERIEPQRRQGAYL